jgi:predicted nucleic acid-binding protein
MKHVFVETNWLFWYAAPEHRRLRDAVRLLERAEAGEMRLHIPSVCLTEARATIPRRFKQRSENPDTQAIKKYLAWAKLHGRIADDEDATVRRILDRFDSMVRSELDRLEATLDETIAALRSNPAIEVFALDDEMLERAIALGASELELEPYDQAVLAGVLVRGSRLRRDGATEVSFCELDGDLQPWDKRGNAKQPLTRMYDEAGIWVYGDFELAEPPPDWWLARFGPASNG